MTLRAAPSIPSPHLPKRPPLVCLFLPLSYLSDSFPFGSQLKYDGRIVCDRDRQARRSPPFSSPLTYPFLPAQAFFSPRWSRGVLSGTWVYESPIGSQSWHSLALVDRLPCACCCPTLPPVPSVLSLPLSHSKRLRLARCDQGQGPKNSHLLSFSFPPNFPLLPLRPLSDYLRNVCAPPALSPIIDFSSLFAFFPVFFLVFPGLPSLLPSPLFLVSLAL